MPNSRREIDPFMSAGAILHSEKLAGNPAIIEERGNFLKKWEGKTQRQIEAEIVKIKRKFEGKPISEIDGEKVGPAWRVAALISLLRK